MGRIVNIGRRVAGIGTAVMLVGGLVLAGCSTHMEKSLTFSVDTGDDVKVTVDTKAGYDITQQDGTFSVIDGDGNAVIEGGFSEASDFQTYKGAVASGSFDGTVTEETEDSISWDYSDADGDEHNRIVLVSDDTAVLMASRASAEDAKAAYGAVTVGLADED